MIATTKIPVLTAIASLFDPLGYLTPTTVKMRLFLQNLWIQEKGWDDQLENGDIETWQKNHNRNDRIIYHFCTEAYWR